MCQNSVAPCEGCSAALKYGRHGEAWRSGGQRVSLAGRSRLLSRWRERLTGNRRRALS